MRIKGKGLQSSRMVTFAPSLVAGETVLNLTRDRSAFPYGQTSARQTSKGDGT